MAYLDINATKSYPSDFTSFYTKGATILDGKYRVDYINDLWAGIPNKFYNKVNGILLDRIAEGQLVYIATGSKWEDVENENHKGEIWVLIDKLNITKPIFEYDPETGVETKTEGPHGWRLLGGETPEVNLKWESL